MTGDPNARSCPFCSGTMNRDATLCAQCGRFSAATALIGGDAARGPAPLDRLNTALAGWERKRPLADRLKEGIDLPLPSKPTTRRNVGIVAILMALFLLVLFLGPNASYYAGRYGIGAAVLGLMLLLYDHLNKPAFEMQRTGPAPKHAPVIRLLGADTSLLAIQVLAMVHLLDRAFWLDVDAARTSAAVIIVLAVVLYPSRVRLAPLLMAGAASAYVVVITGMMTDFAFERHVSDAEIMEPRWMLPVWPLFWLFSAQAAFPQLQVIRWGRFRIGAIKGDIVIDREGTPVLLAFGSTVLIAAAFSTIYATLLAWYWLGVLLR